MIERLGTGSLLTWNTRIRQTSGGTGSPGQPLASLRGWAGSPQVIPEEGRGEEGRDEGKEEERKKGKAEAEEGARAGMPSKLTHQLSFSSCLKGGVSVRAGEQGAGGAGLVEGPPCRRHETVEREVLPLSPTAVIFLAQFRAHWGLSVFTAD